ncbi:MAG TPA: hypothetical protein VHF46_01680 [Rubrobacteraceae bacterium]|nr:hypothetical protein [Rubrobacteraceae bacterium]
METLVGFGIELLRLVPLILVFYIPALMGVILLKERGESYKVKAVLVFLIGFGGVVALQLVLRNASAFQTIEAMLVSLAQIAAALFFAALTVYKLAD